jgi:hypothetical protein
MDACFPFLFELRILISYRRGEFCVTANGYKDRSDLDDISENYPHFFQHFHSLQKNHTMFTAFTLVLSALAFIASANPVTLPPSYPAGPSSFPSSCTLTECQSYINTCGKGYGGCYPICGGYTTPTFTNPGCSPSDTPVDPTFPSCSATVTETIYPSFCQTQCYSSSSSTTPGTSGSSSSTSTSVSTTRSRSRSRTWSWNRPTTSPDTPTGPTSVPPPSTTSSSYSTTLSSSSQTTSTSSQTTSSSHSTTPSSSSSPQTTSSSSQTTSSSYSTTPSSSSSQTTSSSYSTTLSSSSSFSTTSFSYSTPTTSSSITSTSSSSTSCSSGCTRVCADYVNACGQTYGGCYDQCPGQPTPTFTPPPCPSAY